MEKSLEEQQFEVLQTAYEYIGKLINGINMYVENMKENKQEEAINLLSYIVEGIEWLNEVARLTKDIQKENIDEYKMKENLDKISKYLNIESHGQILKVLSYDMLPMLKNWEEVIKKSTLV